MDWSERGRRGRGRRGIGAREGKEGWIGARVETRDG